MAYFTRYLTDKDYIALSEHGWERFSLEFRSMVKKEFPLAKSDDEIVEYYKSNYKNVKTFKVSTSVRGHTYKYIYYKNKIEVTQ